MCTPPRLRKNLSGILLMLLLSFQSIGKAQSVVLSQIQQQSQQEADTTSSKGQSDVEFLIGISQIIEQDKARLQNLTMDSSRMEPVFREKSMQFYYIDNRLDSVRNTEISPVELAMMRHEWEQLRDVLDFMLERRRSVHQQIKILERKLDKEQEAIDFVMKGNMANIWEIIEQRETQKFTDKLSLDSPSISDTIVLDDAEALDQINTNEYNWRIVEAERELEV